MSEIKWEEDIHLHAYYAGHLLRIRYGSYGSQGKHKFKYPLRSLESSSPESKAKSRNILWRLFMNVL